MWWWRSGKLPASSVSLHAGILSPPTSGGKIKLALTSKTTGSRWVTHQGTDFTRLLYSESHAQWFTLSDLPGAVAMGSAYCWTGFVEMKCLFFQVRGGKLTISNTKKSDVGIYVCVAANMVGERESEKAQLSVFGKKPHIRSKSNKAWLFHVCGIYWTPAYAVFTTLSKVYLASVLCVLPTSRKTGVCATACEPGGPSWRDCRVQVSG